MASERTCGAGMHAIKLYAWEGPYVERITELPNAEVTYIRRAALPPILTHLEGFLWVP